MTRRGFIGSAAAFAAMRGFSAVDAVLGGKPNLKFGVLSDVHITSWESADLFRKALRYFREQGVDAVVIPGDMTQAGILCQLKVVADSWWEVFPDDKGLDGKKVERIFINGNHDAEGRLAYAGSGTAETLRSCPGLTLQEAAAQSAYVYGHAKAWEEAFHEPFAPIYRKTVKGYDFIGAHWDTQARVRGLGEFFEKVGPTLDPKKPFFYVQHPHPKDTVYTNGFFSHDDGCATKVLSKYPNAVALTGHSHTTLTDERSVWRGAFTSVGCSTLTAGGCCHPSLTEPLVSCKSTQFPPRQGMLFSVYDDRLVIERRDFTYDLPVDEPWVVGFDDKAEDWAFAARKERSARPEFAADAVLEIVYGRAGKDAVLRFPQAFANAKARAYTYAVTIEQVNGDEKVYTTTFQVNSPTALVPQGAVSRIPIVQFTVPAKFLPFYDVGNYRVTVTPRNSFGQTGRPLVSDWIRVPNM